MRSSRWLPGVLLVLAVAGPLQANEALPVDPLSGLVMADGWQLVRGHCGACHSWRLVTSQRGDAAFWLRTIRWMQRTQNLWPIPEADERTIVTYLGRHYDETERGRRPPLAARLMPAAR